MKKSTLGRIFIDRAVYDLLAKEYVKKPKPVYDMLEETEFLDKLQEEGLENVAD